MRIDLTQSINATPEAVWPWLTEPELMKEWMTGFVNSVATNEVEGVGATWKMSIQEGRRVSEYDGEITAYEPPNHIEIKMWGGCFKSDQVMFVGYHLENRGGSTHIDYNCRMKMHGFFMRIMAAVFAPLGRAQAKKFLVNLKNCVESVPD